MKPQILLDTFFKDKTVFITGHTGFIGSWLSTWLHMLGSKVIGYALEPNISPSLFETLNLEKKITNIIGDIRNQNLLNSYILESKPDIVIHLAAQPLVLLSYQNPVETIETNVIGTVNLLESIRKVPTVKVCINFTSDKCYDNRELDYSYKENDPLGGHDPYSASKASSEIVTTSYRKSFFNNGTVSLASVRAGNVIGGGDWAKNRIVPDCIRSLVSGKNILIRNPNAMRPWQHVLEPISGILWLVIRMWENPEKYNQAWNLGPDNHNITVKELVSQIVKRWGAGSWVDISQQNKKTSHEATHLKLDCTNAKKLLGWNSVYTTEEAISETISWYQHYEKKRINMLEFTQKQIRDYCERAMQQRLVWTKTHDYFGHL